MGYLAKFIYHWPALALLPDVITVLQPINQFYEQQQGSLQQALNEARNPQELFAQYTKNLLPSFFEANFINELDHKRENLYKVTFAIEQTKLDTQDVLCQELLDLVRFWLSYTQQHIALSNSPKMALAWKDYVVVLQAATPYLLGNHQSLGYCKYFYKSFEQTVKPQKDMESWVLHLAWYDEAEAAQQLKTVVTDKNNPEHNNNPEHSPPDQSVAKTPSSRSVASEKKSDTKSNKDLMHSFFQLINWLNEFIAFISKQKEVPDSTLKSLECHEGVWASITVPQQTSDLLYKFFPILKACCQNSENLLFFVGEYQLLSTPKKRILKRDLVKYQKAFEKIIQSWPKTIQFDAYKVSYTQSQEFVQWQSATTKQPLNTQPINPIPLTTQTNETAQTDVSNPASPANDSEQQQNTNDNQQSLTKTLDLRRKEHINFLTER